MNPVPFAITVGVLEGLLFFAGLSWLLVGSTFQWQKAVPFVLAVALPVGAFIGWQSFRSVLAQLGPGPSFLRTLAVGVVGGAFIGVAFILLMPLLAADERYSLSSLLRVALPSWLAIGAVLGLLYATLTWLVNAALVRLAVHWLALTPEASTRSLASPSHWLALVLASLLVAGLLVAGLLVTTRVRHGGPEPEATTPEVMTEVTVTTNAQGLQGAVGHDGREIVPHRFAYVDQISPRFLLVRTMSNEDAPRAAPPRYGIWSVDGQQVIEPRYEGIAYVARHQRFRVSLGDEPRKFGYLDEAGREVIPIIYDVFVRISNTGEEPTNVIRLGERYGYVDIRTGKVLIEPVYDSVQISENMVDAQGQGILLAKLNGKWGVIDTRGRALTGFRFDEMEEVDHETLRGRHADQVETIKFRDGALQP